MRLGLLLWALVSTLGVGGNVFGFVIEIDSSVPSNAPQRQVNEQLIHAEELLEKYGYLSCVPPGSESNNRLHRLLLRRLTATPHSQTNQPLDLRLSPSEYSLLSPAVPKSTAGVADEGRWKDAWMRILQGKRASVEASVMHSQGNRLLGASTDRKFVSVEVLDDHEVGKTYYLPLCSDAEILKAIQRFQETYQVGVENGDLDTPTLAMLSKPRCGNPDDVMEEDSDVPQSNTGRTLRHRYESKVTEFLQRKRRSLTVPERGKEMKPIEYEEFVSDNLKLGLDSLDPVTNSTNQDYLKNKALELREAARAPHPQVEQHTEWEPHPQDASKRRKRWVEDHVAKIHSGEEDARLASLTPHLLAKRRNKRSTFSHLGELFNQDIITWRLVNTGYSSQLGKSVQRASLALAFRMWSEVIPRIFLEDNIPDTEFVDINVGFGKRSHLGCVTEFDGLGGELSHALRDVRDAQIHMDDDEHFTLDSEHGTNLIKVAVHEIGHILGLSHVLRNYSIMYAIYEKILPNQGLELGWEDRKLVQRIYGSCIGPFNTVLDLLRWKPDGSLTYNTFFFRRDHFWMYENRYNRTRFGDPQYIGTEWVGLPNNVDAYTHIWTPTRDAHLFFKGDKYYVYDPVTGSVLPGYPRRIAQDFHGPPTAKNKNPKPIPNNIDTVFFDKRDGNLYFFKGKKVYGYDVSKGSNGCCLPGYPKNIRKEFIAAGRDFRSLPKDLDAAYYSYTDQTVFFIKDRLFWELVSFHPNDKTRENKVAGPFYVHDKWYDICDTMPDPRTTYITE